MAEDYLISPQFKEKLRKEYEELKDSYESLVDEVVYILSDLIHRSKIKVHNITYRENKVKTFESLYAKVLMHRITEKQFEKVEDIAGVRVICLYRSDLERIGKSISESFRVLSSDTSRTRTETPFGYASDHYIVKLPKECKGARYDNIKGLKCEIQVRTILMDAWASVSHHLAYKREVDIPSELKADFNSLAGLFHIADTHFELFRKGVESTRADLMETVRRDTFNLDQEINFDSLHAYLRLKFPERAMELCSPTDIIAELRHYGYVKIRQLDAKVNKAYPVLYDSEREFFGYKKWVEGFNSEGLIGHILELTDDEYFKSSSLSPNLRKPVLKYRAKLR